MAIIKGNYLRGLIGNVIAREHFGQQVIQSKPETPISHRTEGTEKAAKVFGLASKLANAIRYGLHTAYGTYNDGTMIYRLNTEVLHCLNKVKIPKEKIFDLKEDSFQGLAGFEFNINSPVRYQFLVQPQIVVDGTQLHITIPELNLPRALKFPNPSGYCKLALCQAQIDLSSGKSEYMPAQVMDIPYSYRPSTLPSQKFTFDMERGCLNIIGISLQFVEKTFVGDMLTNSKNFNPAAILHTHFTQGEADAKQTEDWHEFDFKINKITN
jgi:hypothetical protein